MTSNFLPRGIRNNNPGNIRLSKTIWQGQKQGLLTDRNFVEFTAPVYGLRTLMKTLLTYYLKYNLDTVESIINRYAPPHENATDSYIRAIIRPMKIQRTDKIDLTSKDVLIAISKLIVAHENGHAPDRRESGWYEHALYEQAAQMILPSLG